jgi:Flp pilus assembly pilin Flp
MRPGRSGRLAAEPIVESGQGIVEYGLILALTSGFTALILGVFGGTLAQILGAIGSAIDAATGG